MVTRDHILTAIHTTLEAEPRALALWEGGSTAFGRADALSDLDLYVLVEDKGVAAVIDAVAHSLEALSPIAFSHRLPEPTRHGHAQVFYLLRDTSPGAMVDLVVMRRSVPERFLEEERHGIPRVLFDHTGEIGPMPLDREAHTTRLAGRLATLRTTFPLFRGLVQKEIERGDAMAAIGSYHALTLRPLLEVIRMLHCPERYDYGAKYSTPDLPPEVVSRLERLWYIGSPGDLAERQAEAEAWFAETVTTLDHADPCH